MIGLPTGLDADIGQVFIQGFSMLGSRRFFALAVILIATLVSVSVVHGIWTDRWVAKTGMPSPLDLEKIPVIAGGWEGKTVEGPSAQQILADGTNNYLVRRYVNHADGALVNVLMTHGRPGPLVMRHLPTECYLASGYELVGEPKRFLSPSSDKQVDEFWVATFKKTTDVVPVTVRVYWSWSADGLWQIPERPRVTFAPYPVIYKLYVTQNLRSENEEFEGAPAHDLIKELTSAMRGSIFSSVRP
jgi:hypothetical protein